MIARVPPLHPLEREIVAGLQRQMQMRHQPRLVRDRIKQRLVGLDGIDGRQPKPVEFGYQLQDLLDQTAERQCSGQIAAIGSNIDARQHDFAVSALNERTDLCHHLAGRNRTGRTASEGNDTECTAMIAAILNLDVGAGPRPKS